MAKQPTSSKKAKPVKPVAKPAASAKPVAPKAAVEAPQADSCCGGTSSCCSTDVSCCSGESCCGSCGGLFSFCPLFSVLSTARFWVGLVLAFVVIFLFDIVWQGNLMDAYRATAGMWKPEGAMDVRLLYVGQLLTAFVLTALVQLVAWKGWWGSMVIGALAAAPRAIGAFMAYATMPFPDGYIPTMWIVGALLQGALVGLVLNTVFRSHGCGCGSDCGCGK